MLKVDYSRLHKFVQYSERSSVTTPPRSSRYFIVISCTCVYVAIYLSYVTNNCLVDEQSHQSKSSHNHNPQHSPLNAHSTKSYLMPAQVAPSGLISTQDFSR